MRNDLVKEFLFDPHTIQLNHASYGTPTRISWDHIARLRRELELDTASHLGDRLAHQFEDVSRAVRAFLGLTGGELAFTLNSTEGHETVARSLIASGRDFSISLRDDEYESMKSTWLVGIEPQSHGVSVTIHNGPLSGAYPIPDVSVASIVASSTGRLSDPREAAASWVSVIDASHAPGHVDLVPWTSLKRPTAIIGSLHKWIPAVRPVGFIWLSDDWPVALRPAVASLRESYSTALELLSWRGTWDTTPHLAVPTALTQWSEWYDAGLIADAEALADVASAALEGIGITEWNAPACRAPRLRSFVIPGVNVEELKAELERARINTWVGIHLGQSIIRLSFNIYNNSSDVERVVDVLRGFSGNRHSYPPMTETPSSWLGK